MLPLFQGCNSDAEVTRYFDELRDGEGIIKVKINGNDFYGTQNRFKGEVYVLSQVFRLNVFDQYKSNFIFSFEEKDDYKVKPYFKKLYAENQIAASIMMGRLADTTSTQGEGYVMTEGDIKVVTIHEKKLMIHFKGKGAKFESFNAPEKWDQIEGWVLFKRPVYKLEGVMPENLFYAR